MIYPDFGVKYIAFTQYFHSGHKAVDIPRYVTVNGKANPMANENIYFPHDMKLTVNSYAKDYGYFVRGEYKDGKDTWRFSSGHFDSKPNLEVGKTYKRGDFMAKCGKLGQGSTGYHNHFVVEKNGVRVNPLDVCYVYPDQVVGSKEFAKLKYIIPITPVERDTSKDQLKTLKYMNVRKTPSLSGEIIGQADTGSVFDYYETVEADNYTWYRIEENQWIAQDKDKTYLEIMPAETKDYKKLYEEELVKNEKLELENKDLRAQLEQANDKLNQIKIIVN
jgi:hypothetical protein